MKNKLQCFVIEVQNPVTISIQTHKHHHQQAHLGLGAATFMVANNLIHFTESITHEVLFVCFPPSEEQDLTLSLAIYDIIQKE